jgi:hypothetical protein
MYMECVVFKLVAIGRLDEMIINDYSWFDASVIYELCLHEMYVICCLL